MPCLEKIPLNLIPEKVIKQLHLNKNKDALSIVKELLEIAESLIQLKVFFKVSYISKKGEGIVEIDGQTFSSRVLRKNLDDVERVFPILSRSGKLWRIKPALLVIFSNSIALKTSAIWPSVQRSST
jgi:hypothetical protein